jgi:multidrug resistance efflux pump
MLHRVRYLACLALVLAGCDLAPQAGPGAPAAKGPAGTGAAAAATKPGRYTVRKGPFKIEVALKGTLEAEGMSEVAYRPEAQAAEAQAKLTVVKAVEHGTPVRKGDVLVRLDTSKMDQAIRDLRADRRQAEVALKLAEEEFPFLEKSAPQELTAAERAKTRADEDLKRFLDVGREASAKAAEFAVKSATHSLAYAKEELRQLEKMYRADDLREETEEIILKRQRHAVEAAEFALRTAKRQRDRTIKLELPRREQTLKESADRLALALDRIKATQALTLAQKRSALERMKNDLRKTADRFRKLGKDRAAMTLHAPADGIVYYGKCERGQWTTAAVTGKLRPGGTLTADEVVVTVVKPRPLFVRALVDEKQLSLVRVGSKGKVVATADADLRLPATVEKVSRVPVAPGRFEARIAVELPEHAAALMPGMACTVKLVPYVQRSAVAVPEGAVFTDELDDDKHFVYAAGKNGKPYMRPVAVGRKCGGRVEIVDGLAEGDKVWLEKPAETAKAESTRKGATP